MTIKIPVSADFDPSQVEAKLKSFEQRLNTLGKSIAQANKVQFNPVGKQSVDGMAKLLQQFEALKRISGDLNRRMKATGQGDAGFLDVNWDKLYPDHASRNRQMRKVFEYVTGQQFTGGPGSPGGSNHPGGHGGRGGGGGGGAGIVSQVAGAGLRAMGPAGGVAAGAMGSGMSAGFGAGLAGLVGGMLALGVSKIVGGVMEKMDQAEQNMIGYDRLKRSIGDVNVSFDALRSVVENSAKNIHVTFDEASRLGTQFAKLGNLTADQHQSLGKEIELGGGLSRAFGLDPSVGVGFMGQMRGMRQTTDIAESRRFALLVGETIGKSGAFSKADEVMEAIAGYTTQQTRASLSANTEGYAGMLAGLIGSNIPGLDPTGASGLMSAVNASLSRGGAKGEASQFFTSMIGQKHGLDPLKMQLWREGGAMATLDGTFGKNSAASRLGISGPGGSQTFLDATLSQLRESYGNDPAMMAHAAANHLGINMSQAAALLTVDSKQMGEITNRLGPNFDMTKLKGSGIGAMAKVLGTDQDRAAIAEELLGRQGKDALSREEAGRLRGAMASGSVDEQKNVLLRLLAERDQEQTQGKDIHDSKVFLENLKTDIATRLIPLTQEMRNAMMYLAGGKDGKSPLEIQKELASIEIGSKYQRQIDAQYKRIDEVKSHKWSGGLVGSEYAAREAEGREIYRDAYEKIGTLKEERDAAIQTEYDRLDSEQTKIDEESRRVQMAHDSAAPDQPIPGIHPMADLDAIDRRVSAAHGDLAVPLTAEHQPTTTRFAALGEDAGSVIKPNGKRTRGYRNNNPGNIEATSPWQGMTGSDGRFATFATPHHGYRALGKNLLTYNKKYGLDSIRGIINRWAPPNENDTGAYIRQIEKELGVGADDKLNMQDQETIYRLIRGISRHENGYLRHDDSVMRGGAADALGQPIPDTGSPSGGSQQDFRFGLDPLSIDVYLRNENGDSIAPPQSSSAKLTAATPFGLR